MSTTKPTNFQQYEHESEKFVNGFRADNPKAIVQYVRFSNKPKSKLNGNGGKARQRRGVIVAFIGMSGELRIGWSLFNVNHESHAFSRPAGLRKAIERAKQEHEYNFSLDYRADDPSTHHGVPQTIRRPIQEVLEKAKRYYKIG